MLASLLSSITNFKGLKMFKVQDLQEVHYWSFDVDFYINGEFARVSLTDKDEFESINIHKLVSLIMKQVNHIATSFDDNKALINLVSDDNEVILNLEFNIPENLDFLKSLGFVESENIWRSTGKNPTLVLEEECVFNNLPALLEHFITERK
nr:MAG TPA: hypothetical protein [Caudoviricetes sp.]